jgi:sugar diacid utilization regulator
MDAEEGLPGEFKDLAGMAVYVHASRLSGSESARTVRELADRGASALLVWAGPGTGGPQLTEATLAATTAELPLLLLPRRADFQETSRLIATKVLAQSTHVLEYGTRVHRTLGDVFARGGGLPALAHTMAQLSGTTVLVMGNAGELLTSAAPMPTGADQVDTLAAAVRTFLSTQSAASDLVAERHDTHPAQIVALELEGSRLHAVVAPVLVAGEPYGFLTLVEPDFPAAEHNLSQHVVIAEQGVSLTGSELLRQQSVREAQERARNDFVHALLHGRFTDRLELAARAEHYRFPLDGRFVVYVVTAPGLHPDESASRRKAHDAARVAASALPDGERLVLTALIGSMIVLVRELKPIQLATTDSHNESGDIRTWATQLRRLMRQRLSDDVRISFGGPDTGAAGVARSYREARTAEALGRRVSTGPVSSYSELRVFAAIEQAAASPAGQAFATDILGPLQQADGQTGNLQEVVLAYIDESGNLNATARRLHLHRNTMLYKLDRASRALQMDVRTTEAQFMVWLAHHITALSEVTGGLDRELAPPT